MVEQLPFIMNNFTSIVGLHIFSWHIFFCSKPKLLPRFQKSLSVNVFPTAFMARSLCVLLAVTMTDLVGIVGIHIFPGIHILLFET